MGAEEGSFFGWYPVVQNMFYSVSTWPESEEELTVFSKTSPGSTPADTFYNATRVLSDNATPAKNTRIDVYVNGKDRYIVFPDGSICPPKFYKQKLCADYDESPSDIDPKEAFSCFSPLENSFHCGTPKDVYYGKTGKAIEDDYMWAASKAAKYYADFLNSKIENGSVTAEKRYTISEGGELKQSRGISFEDVDANKKFEEWSKWRYAQGCKYCSLEEKELKGTKEPSCPTTVEEISIWDDSGDGTVDGVHADWVKAAGGFRVDKRSTYTEGLLKYFDGSLNKAEDNVYSYVTPTIPADLEVKQGDWVPKGKKLFSYDTTSGRKTFYAEFDGAIKNLDTEHGFYLEMKKQGEEKTIVESILGWFK